MQQSDVQTVCAPTTFRRHSPPPPTHGAQARDTKEKGTHRKTPQHIIIPLGSGVPCPFCARPRYIWTRGKCDTWASILQERGDEYHQETQMRKGRGEGPASITLQLCTHTHTRGQLILMDWRRSNARLLVIPAHSHTALPHLVARGSCSFPFFSLPPLDCFKLPVQSMGCEAFLRPSRVRARKKRCEFLLSPEWPLADWRCTDGGLPVASSV